MKTLKKIFQLSATQFASQQICKYFSTLYKDQYLHQLNSDMTAFKTYNIFLDIPI